MTIPPDPDEALRALLQQYGTLIRKIVSRVGGGVLRDKQDDVTQDVALSLWQQVSREQTITHHSSYIYRAAVRETVRAVKRELDRIRAHASVDDTGAPILPSTAPSPEQSAASAQLGRGIERAIGELLPERAIAVRAHLAGYSVEEIMGTTGWPYQKARNLIARGMSDLREQLAKDGYRV